MTVHVNAAFDSGNIRVVGQEGDRLDLEIVADNGSDFYQWFHFRVAGAKGRRLEFRIVNAGGAAYAFGWPGYRARMSADRVAWRQVETGYADGVLSFSVAIDTDLAWFAYFAPYTLERHDALVSRMALAPGVSHEQLGTSLDGRPIDYLRVGHGPRQVWAYARQHPGESMCEWFMEGLLERLSDAQDAVAAALGGRATFHCVPNMNPDGSFRGHLRTNAAGVNLNREWHAPSAERSPEVLCVLERMDRTGVDFAIDVHGDEAIPANFIAGYHGIPNWTDEHGARFTEFGRRWAAASPDFQTELGYPESAAGRANLSMSTNQLAHRFGAVSMTLEMPFKDHDANPDPTFGWSPERSKRLAHSFLDVLDDFLEEG